MPVIDNSCSSAHHSAGAPVLVDIRKTATGREIILSAPGWQSDDFKLKVEDGMLIVDAKMEDRTEEQQHDHTLRQYCCRSFSWSYLMDHPVSPDKIQLNYRDGLLHILLVI